MHLAIAGNFDYEEWLSGNTFLCLRYQARLTHAACEHNRCQSTKEIGGDDRCQGCNGLHDQPDPAAPRLHLVASPSKEEEPGEDPFVEMLQSILKSDLNELDSEDVDEEIDLSDFFTDLDDLDSGILDQFSELRDLLDDSEPDIPVRKKEPKPKKYAVYQGRCQRCGGYMVWDIEGQFGNRDDDVYRCYNCGWRISPIYLFNRGSDINRGTSHGV
jgi:hypothetical protein